MGDATSLPASTHRHQTPCIPPSSRAPCSSLAPSKPTPEPKRTPAVPLTPPSSLTPVSQQAKRSRSPTTVYPPPPPPFFFVLSLTPPHSNSIHLPAPPQIPPHQTPVPIRHPPPHRRLRPQPPPKQAASRLLRPGRLPHPRPRPFCWLPRPVGHQRPRLRQLFHPGVFSSSPTPRHRPYHRLRHLPPPRQPQHLEHRRGGLLLWGAVRTQGCQRFPRGGRRSLCRAPESAD